MLQVAPTRFFPINSLQHQRLDYPLNLLFHQESSNMHTHSKLRIVLISLDDDKKFVETRFVKEGPTLCH